MPLETSTYINGLTASWPTAGDPKTQGDDQLRLIKSVLQGTFPSGDRAFYFPKAEGTAGAMTLDATDQNNIIFVNTGAGDVNVTLPAGFGVVQAGWSCEVVKTSVDYNAAMVYAASGTILSKSGSTASIRVGVLCEPARFIWSGSGWVCSKTGPLVGSTVYFDGPTLPYGYLQLDGSVFNGTTFAELAAMLGTTTLRDKRGYVEAGVDSATNRLGGQVGSGANGQTGGLYYHYLTLNELPTGITGAGSAAGIVVNSTVADIVRGSVAPFNTPGTGVSFLGVGPGSGTSGITSTGSGSANVTVNNAGGFWHPIVQPTMVTNKLIRAC